MELHFRGDVTSRDFANWRTTLCLFWQNGSERYGHARFPIRLFWRSTKDINGQDPYEIPKNEWLHDLDSWPSVTYIHIGMYLLFNASPYTQEQLMNYKSLDCYQNCAIGWVREVFSEKFGENRLLIAKVRSVRIGCNVYLIEWKVFWFILSSISGWL